MPKRTSTEYAGDVPSHNSVQGRGLEDRELEPHEKLRLGYLTGQTDDVDAPAKSGFFYGVDPDNPENPDIEIDTEFLNR
jgi:hypothetical protein